MLTNSVILFLRDLLPIFILFAYCQSVLSMKISASTWLIIIAVCGPTAALYVSYSPHISEMFDGAGLEITNAIALTSFALLSVAAMIFKRHKSTLMLSAAMIYAVLKLSGFYVYFSANWQTLESLKMLLLALCLGLGISISFVILWSFFLTEMKQKKLHMVNYVAFASFIAGNAAQASYYLAQVNILSASEPAFDLSFWISDKSEYGHLLKALIGFESSPSFGFVSIYGCLMVIFVVMSLTPRAAVNWGKS